MGGGERAGARGREAVNSIGPLRRTPLPVLACLLMLAAGAAAAQRPTSSNDRITAPGIRRGDAARTDPDFRHVITCTEQREPTRSRNLIRSIPGSNAEARIIYSYQSRLDQCYPRQIGGLGFSYSLLRGGFAELFYHRDFPGGLPAAQAPGEAAIAWTHPRSAEGEVTSLELLHAVARCVVVRNPAAVRGLLANAPFSAGELAGMQSIQADLAACITAGVRFTASRQSLRGLLAEAALHYGEALANGFRPDLAGAARPR